MSNQQRSSAAPSAGSEDWFGRWFLTATERGNPATRLDGTCEPGTAWTRGNEVRPLVHGATYFTELCRVIGGTRAGDLVFFTDWRGDPDERLDGPGTEVGRVLCEAARRGVVVKGLIWRSHLDGLQFSEAENRHLGDEIEDAGGEALLDMRVRTNGSHHQKFIVVRHPGRPEDDVAFVGGIDLCHSRRDTAAHDGDPQAIKMSTRYGPRPPWHDVQVAIRGPAVAVVETVFRERWEDPTPLTRNPFHRLRDLLTRQDTRPNRLPEQLPAPRPRGTQAVQLLRTYPYRRTGYPFAPHGERSVARGYEKALRQARRLIYVEDQYLWSHRLADYFARALHDNPDLHLIAVVPRYPDQDGAARTPQLVGRAAAIARLRAAGGDRVALYFPENHAGDPVYVHAKVCVIDDVWASVGSDNVNMRSWSYDTELACAVLDEREPDAGFARDLRLELHREHLDRDADHDRDLRDPDSVFTAFAASAQALESWHAGGRVGPRPPGRLRVYPPPDLSWWSRSWADSAYRLLFDPDGRPRDLRRARSF